MTVSEKAKEKLDEASKEIKEAIDSLRKEVTELSDKVKEKLKGSGKETRESTEELTKEVKTLSERVKDLIPKRRKKSQLPIHVDRPLEYQAEVWDQSFMELRRATDRLFEVKSQPISLSHRCDIRAVTETDKSLLNSSTKVFV